MNFTIFEADRENVSDSEITELLYHVYVKEGFTSEAKAQKIFDSVALRARGRIFAARDKKSQILAGMVISVSANSSASKLARQDNEIEMHLLAVSPPFRLQGLAKALVNHFMQDAKLKNVEKILLYSQPTMKAAHSLYSALGFQLKPGKSFQSEQKDFWVFEKIF